ncbi:MAG: hypothetical protein ABIJ96_15355 [Elusimicrobiota bacterium]
MKSAWILAALLASPVTAAVSAPEQSGGKQIEVNIKVDKLATGGIVKFGENIRITEGEEIAGPVVAIGGSIRSDGHIDGPAVSVGGSVELGPSAVVEGPVVSLGGRTHRAEGSRIEGPIVDLPGTGVLGRFAAAAAYIGAASAAIYIVAKASTGIGWIVLSLVLVALFPKSLRQTKDHLSRKFTESALVGLIAWPALLVISLTLLVSIIGMPLVPLLLTIAAAAYVWGFAAIAYLLGERLSMGRWKSPFASMAVGMLILKLLQWVPIVQWIVFSAVAIVGVGASILSRFGLKNS